MSVRTKGRKNKQSPTLTPEGQDHHMQVEKLCTDGRTWMLLTRQVPEAMQREHRLTDRRQLRETESVIFQAWRRQFTEGLVEGGSGSSGSAGENVIQNTSSTYSRDPRSNLEGNTICALNFHRVPIVIYANAQKITRAPCRRESRQSRRLDTTSYKMRRYNHTGARKSSMKRKNRDCIDEVIWLLKG